MGHGIQEAKALIIIDPIVIRLVDCKTRAALLRLAVETYHEDVLDKHVSLRSKADWDLLDEINNDPPPPPEEPEVEWFL